MKKKIAKRLLTLVNKLKNEGRDQLNGIKDALKISIILSKRAKHRFRGELPHQFAYNFYSRPLHTSSQNFKRSSLRHQTIFDFMQASNFNHSIPLTSLNFRIFRLKIHFSVLSKLTIIIEDYS
jgi:hypothetical protein